ncbi:hypothetical protein L873DRAFT_1793842 [Choiromyces venosus 120613-1]|uniref:Uncharacterized protein n=1 Tax=Choiromyces venosus 120613-1 TaxID=1336337 RepID=A0A3N4J779_9PEZI|nr:hypothetical protein L873DRAFT_1793842 [Choiromyces venosus 120613-1]
MVELVTHWDQSSTDPEMRKHSQMQAAHLEVDGKRVRKDSMRGLVYQREEEQDGSESGTGYAKSIAPPKKKAKNWAVKVEKDKKELKELEKKADQKHEDIMYRILGLTEEIQEQSTYHSHDALLECEVCEEELVLILEALRKDKEI